MNQNIENLKLKEKEAIIKNKNNLKIAVEMILIKLEGNQNFLSRQQMDKFKAEQHQQ